MEEKKPVEDQPAAVPKVFDVARPGRTVPSATARPVIMTRQAVVRDQMVTKAPAVDGASVGARTKRESYLAVSDEASDQTSTPTYPELLPTAETESSDTEEKPLAAAVVKEPAQKVTISPLRGDGETTEEAPKDGKLAPLTGAVHLEKQETASTEDELDEIDEFAGRAAQKQAKKAEEDEEIVRLASAQALADSKQYVVPVRSQRSNKIWLWVLVGLLFAAGAALGYLYYSFKA